MHSHDRTLLASLAFGDPDKKSPKHDLACQYLSTVNPAEKIADLVIASRDVPIDEEWGTHDKEVELKGMQCRCRGEMRKVETERPITKGEGQYKTIVGFIDVFIETERVSVVYECNRREKSKYKTESEWSDWQPAKDYSPDRPEDRFVVIEVKINPTSIGEILRQVRLYAEFFPADRTAFVVATAFPITEQDKQQLKAVRITHIRLGEKFEAFCQQQAAAGAAPASSSPEI